MMAMHDLDFFAADESRGAKDELESCRACGPVSKNGAPSCAMTGANARPAGPAMPDLLAEAMQLAAPV